MSILNKSKSMGNRHFVFQTMRMRQLDRKHEWDLEDFRSIKPDEDICSFTATTIDPWGPCHELMEGTSVKRFNMETFQLQL